MNRDLVIIGGGASGMTAAIVAKRLNPNLKICIVEKNPILGKKIAATGNGRCNIANKRAEGFSEIVEFLKSCHIALAEEQEGWMYPKSREAASVVRLLEAELQGLGVEVIFDFEVEAVEKQETGGFLLRGERKQKSPLGIAPREIFAHRLLLAAGGKAAPQFGTAGAGASLGRRLGHSTVQAAPVLTPLLCDMPYGAPGELKGVRTTAQLWLCRGGKPLQAFKELGELQFTADGLSGICIFNLSRQLRIPFSDHHLEVDFLPEISKEELIAELNHRKLSMSGFSGHFLTESIINSKLGKAMLRSVSSAEKIREISDDEIVKLAEMLKNSKFRVTGAKGWKDAQCTRGGISLEEVDSSTMESKLIEGLFFAGEVLDFDGACGGYNLSYAWYTGIKAGRGATFYS